MGLYAIKPAFVRSLRGVEDRLVARSVTPDALTRGAVVVSIAAGIAVAAGGILDRPLVWLAVPPLVLVRLALNALDGSIARRTRTETRTGAMLNELGDRIGDVAMIGSIGFVVGPVLAIAAVTAALFSSFIGVLAQALTGTRDYAGPMGKPDRAALLATGAFVAAITDSTTPFTVAAAVIAFGSLASASIRAGRLRAALHTLPIRLHADARPHFVTTPGEDDVDLEALHGFAR